MIAFQEIVHSKTQFCSKPDISKTAWGLKGVVCPAVDLKKSLGEGCEEVCRSVRVLCFGIYSYRLYIFNYIFIGYIFIIDYIFVILY